MKILMAHNYYRSLSPCGENQSFEQEVAMLREHGNEVVTYVTRSDDIAAYSSWKKARLPLTATWSMQTRRALKELLQREQPDLAHFQNTFPLISPSAYSACRAHGIPVVQTLRNFRPMCPAASFYRKGRVCEDCRDRSIKWPAVVHRCYQHSLPASAAAAGMLSFHHLKGTWHRSIDAYIAPSKFVRDKYMEAGFDAKRLHLKPNFLYPDPGPMFKKENFMLYVGRFSSEKGILRLLKTWPRLKEIPLVLLGDGEQAGAVRQFLKAHPELDVQMPGMCSGPEVMQWLQRASWCLLPSQWYESFGRVIIEAYACGTPVIATDLGAIQELVDEGNTGLKVPPDNPGAWVEKIRWAEQHPEKREQMSRQARAAFEQAYTMPLNYTRLMEIYESVMAGYSASHESA